MQQDGRQSCTTNDEGIRNEEIDGGTRSTRVTAGRVLKWRWGWAFVCASCGDVQQGRASSEHRYPEPQTRIQSLPRSTLMSTRLAS